MKTFLIIYLILIIIVVSVFELNRFIPDVPKSKFGKWWRKHIAEYNENYD